VPQIALTTFLKLLTRGTPEKVGEYSKYLSPGGYDYYWSLKAAASELTINGKPLGECEAQIKGSVRRASELEHNLSGLNSLAKWVAVQKGAFFKPPHAICWSPKKHLGVKLEPEFGLKTSEGSRIITLWNAKTSELSQRVAGVGIYLMKQHLRLDGHPNCEFSIFDLRKQRSFVALEPPTHIASMVASEFAWVDQFFESMRAVA
jgi:hypothetical protein